QPEATATMPRLPPALEPPAAHERPTPPSPAPASAATDPASAPVADAAIAAPARAAIDMAQPAPARPAAPTTSPARQIAPVIVSVAIGGGTARLAVTLEPAELGRVEISVERSGDTSQVQILAERPETLALLQRDQRELDRALSQAGVATEGRSVSLGLATDGGAGQQAWQDRRDARPGPRRTADIPAPAAEPRRAVLSLLDLAV
ncbi:flagellar hook-length control protein FliK, partial [Neoroseomonas oryzicola]